MRASAAARAVGVGSGSMSKGGVREEGRWGGGEGRRTWEGFVDCGDGGHLSLGLFLSLLFLAFGIDWIGCLGGRNWLVLVVRFEM